MTNETATAAIIGLIAAMVDDAAELQSRIEIAQADIIDGRRNGAIGAMSSLDETLERIAASISAARAINRAVVQ